MTSSPFNNGFPAWVLRLLLLQLLCVCVLAGGVAASNAERAQAVEDCAPHPRCVFVIAIGRSASTSVLDIINQLPNHYLMGENNAAFIHFAKMRVAWNAHAALTELGGLKPNDEWKPYSTAVEQQHKKPAWYQQVNDREFMCHARRLFKVLQRPHELSDEEFQQTVIGFKEIRYATTHRPKADVELGLSFLLELCASTKFVFHTRVDREKLSKSDWWRKWDFKELAGEVAITERMWRAFAQSNNRTNVQSYFSEMESMVKEVPALLRFLEVPEDTQVDPNRLSKEVLLAARKADQQKEREENATAKKADAWARA